MFPRPPSPTYLSRATYRSDRMYEKERQLAKGRGGKGVGVEPNHTTKKSWPSIHHSILAVKTPPIYIIYHCPAFTSFSVRYYTALIGCRQISSKFAPLAKSLKHQHQHRYKKYRTGFILLIFEQNLRVTWCFYAAEKFVSYIRRHPTF